jgi:hypothetical protein
VDNLRLVQECILLDFDEKNIFICSSNQSKFHKVLLILKKEILIEASFGNTHKILNLEPAGTTWVVT